MIKVSLGFAIWVKFHCQVRLVSASQPPFLIMICFGMFVMALIILFLGIDDEIATVRMCDFACMAGPWLIALGFTFTFSASLSKIWRINWILREASKFRRVQVKITDVMNPFFCILFWNAACLST